MLKKIFSIVLTMAAISPAAFSQGARPSGTWQFHTTFNPLPARVFQGPTLSYYLARPQVYRADIPDNNRDISFLFSIDQVTGEVRPLGRQAGLSSDLIAAAEYNPQKEYLLLVHEDYSIDLLYDNGEVVNIPALRSFNGASDKKVNSITFDPENDRAYLATNFGFISINDSKGEVADSRLYRTPLKSVARAGDKFLVTDGLEILVAPADNIPLSLEDYRREIIDGEPYQFLPLGDEACGLLTLNNKQNYLWKLDLKGETLSPQELRSSYGAFHSRNRDGYIVALGNRMGQLKEDGTLELSSVEAADANNQAASYGNLKFIFAPEGSGYYYRLLSKPGNPAEWTTLSEPSMPDAPRPFQSTCLAWSPNYGFLAANHDLGPTFSNQALHNPLQLSGLKDGSWTQYGFADRNPQQIPAFSNPSGPVIDPMAPNMAYFGSLLTGLLRVNLDDPTDILHLSRPDASWDQLPGFVKVHEVNQDWAAVSSFSRPAFDQSGNLWTVFMNFNQNPAGELWVWTPEARLASRNASQYRAMTRLSLGSLSPSSSARVLPLSGSNAGILLISDGAPNAELMVYDTKGTPTTASDDQKRSFTLEQARDQDGQALGGWGILDMIEDTQTGLVWIATDSGIITVNPRVLLAGGNTVNRFKIARNDGTSLADYLLDGVAINNIVTDPRNRKWLATRGAGLVCVAADGSEVITTADTSNSELPSDEVYAIAYSPDLATMMVSTSNGLAEYRPYTVGDGTDFDYARAYPNPVTPDYLGYVTIDGLVDSSIVKIVDAKGHLVRELGFAASGQVTWDLANIHGKRVGSGVYYVLASTGPNDDAMSKATKILVIN